MDRLDGNGNVVDEKGINNGSRYWNVVRNNGKYGKAFTFDGNGDYVSIPSTSSLSMGESNAVSIGAWFNAMSDGIPTTLEIVNKRNNDPTYVSYGISWGNSGDGNRLNSRLGFTDGSVSDLRSEPVSKNEWHYGIQTWNGTVNNLYLDGVLVSSSISSGKTIADNNYPVTIGSYDGNSEFFTGSIDEVVSPDTASMQRCKRPSLSRINCPISTSTPGEEATSTIPPAVGGSTHVASPSVALCFSIICPAVPPAGNPLPIGPTSPFAAISRQYVKAGVPEPGSLLISATWFRIQR